MRILAAASAIAFLALTVAAAHAQMAGGNPTTLTQQRAARPHTAPKADEQAYKNALQSIPVAKEKPDPWKTMR
jgi:hypothetical protein